MSKRRAPKRRARKPRQHTVAKVITSSALGLALATGVGVTSVYNHLSGNLDVLDVSDQLSDRPDKVEVSGPMEPLNILIMGSDSRDGEGNDIDGLTGGGQRSDTTMILHVSADRERAFGVSLPRDAIIDRPECTTEDGEEIPAESGVMFNTAYAYGGPGCTQQTVEQLTGIRIDHIVDVDFAGFEAMVDAIDGVEVCIPTTVDDPAHDIYLEAGTRELEGREALAYVRERYQLSANSDIGRMKRQQAFVASMANKLVSADTLSRPDRLVSFLNAATKSLTLDPELDSVGKLSELGLQFRNTGLNKIRFMTVPIAPYEPDPNRLVWTSEADQLWDKIINDEPIGADLSEGVITAAKPQGGSTGDGSGKKGGATSDEEAAELAANGLCT
ncbi:LCP family protein [Nocardioides sp. CFH 31398]|uniref:LCP family protein n=1 Tax=Nocardioides sp. CFH 31398 TaxID=2919579 RepID=UPI001F069B9E|nr:LCP family protein [Nocardioides sp. CFH 31398]MCH1865281.1 LCP family protein [Nocardioides sp. CFH 31398]